MLKYCCLAWSCVGAVAVFKLLLSRFSSCCCMVNKVHDLCCTTAARYVPIYAAFPNCENARQYPPTFQPSPHVTVLRNPCPHVKSTFS